MRVLALTALLVSTTMAAAQTAPPPIVQGEPETVYSDAQREADQSLTRRTLEAVLSPMDSVEDQYARWRRPVCVNVYGLTPSAKYVVEKRIRDIAAQVGAPIDRNDPCAPNVLIAFTENPRETLESIARVRPYLVPGLGQIRSRAKEGHPVQAWYTTMIRGRGQWVMEYDGFEQEPQTVAVWDMSRLQSGIETQIGAATIVVDTRAVMGRTLGALADQFALLALAQARTTASCKPVQTIANLLRTDCDPQYQAQGMTEGDIALLTGLYRTPDDTMQRLQKSRIMGNMRKSLEAQFGK